MIKNIIFDLGGVILNIDYTLTSKAFQALGVTQFDELYSQASQSHLFDDLETGKISDEAFRDEVRHLTGLQMTDQQIDDAWNAMLLDLPAERITILKQAKQHYRTFLLSNTNSIHLDAYTKELQKVHDISSLAELFEKEHYSHVLQLRKPHPETFMHVLEMHGLKTEETLFIDDSYQHIEGAEEAGIKTFFMDRTKELNLNHIFTDGKLTIEF